MIEKDLLSFYSGFVPQDEDEVIDALMPFPYVANLIKETIDQLSNEEIDSIISKRNQEPEILNIVNDGKLLYRIVYRLKDYNSHVIRSNICILAICSTFFDVEPNRLSRWNDDFIKILEMRLTSNISHEFGCIKMYDSRSYSTIEGKMIFACIIERKTSYQRNFNDLEPYQIVGYFINHFSDDITFTGYEYSLLITIYNTLRFSEPSLQTDYAIFMFHRFLTVYSDCLYKKLRIYGVSYSDSFEDDDSGIYSNSLSLGERYFNEKKQLVLFDPFDCVYTTEISIRTTLKMKFAEIQINKAIIHFLVRYKFVICNPDVDFSDFKTGLQSLPTEIRDIVREYSRDDFDLFLQLCGNFPNYNDVFICNDDACHIIIFLSWHVYQKFAGGHLFERGGRGLWYTTMCRRETFRQTLIDVKKMLIKDVLSKKFKASKSGNFENTLKRLLFHDLGKEMIKEPIGQMSRENFLSITLRLRSCIRDIFTVKVMRLKGSDWFDVRKIDTIRQNYLNQEDLSDIDYEDI
jgi:hypothetical protein